MTNVIAYLTFKDPRGAIEFYKKALRAEEAIIMDGPGDSVMHAEINIGETQLMLSGEYEGFNIAPEGASPVNFVVNVENADMSWKHAIDCGMQSVTEPQDMFWGARSASAIDPYGYRWNFMHHVEDVSVEEMKTRAKAFAESMT